MSVLLLLFSCVLLNCVVVCLLKHVVFVDVFVVWLCCGCRGSLLVYVSCVFVFCAAVSCVCICIALCLFVFV